MQLLGPYRSSLVAFHYQELLALYKQAIALGDFAGNKTFDEATINALIKQAKDFASLPQAFTGQRVTDNALNNPLDLLMARYNALVSEADSFDVKAAGLISILEKDTILLDELLTAARLQDWLIIQPKLEAATKFSWDYGIGTGASSREVFQIDPHNEVAYTTNCQTNTYLDLVDASKFTGLVAPEDIVDIPAKNMIWNWTKMTPGEQAEDLYGDGWAELTLLEDKPLVNFLPTPSVQTLLPLGGSTVGVFSVAGQVLGGSLPIYVRTVFTPRRNVTTLVPYNALPDSGFELGGVNWRFGAGWSLQTGAGAHTGFKYASKAPLPAWNSVTAYVIGNTVNYSNRDYVCISNNTNQLPSAPSSTFWAYGGFLESESFPLAKLNRIYVEAWLKNVAANGIVFIGLSCRDHNDKELQPVVYLPGVTNANNWVQVTQVLTAIDDPSVVAGRLTVYVSGQTTGSWSLDDFRVHTPQNLSAYVTNQDEVEVYIPKPGSVQPLTVYFENEQFVVDDISNITFMNLTDGLPYTVRFTENYPAYQCSVNEQNWSPLIMLDPNRPYPDTEKNFYPIQLALDSSGHKTLFPITDETGIPTGLTLQMLSRPATEYYFLVTTPAQPQYGATAILEIDLSRPTFMNGLTLAPFSQYPLRLVKVETESFTVNTRQIVGTPGALLDRPMVLTFPTTLLRKIYLTIYQENYELSEHQIAPPDSLRRDTLFSLQPTLPFKAQRVSRSVPVFYRGAQYAFGLEDIAGISTTPVLPGIFIAGPHHFSGCPEVFRFDASIEGVDNFNTYLCWKAYNSSNVLINSELNGYPINPGDCSIWPFPTLSILDRTTVDHVDIFLKFVLRGKDVVLERYLLQVTPIVS